MSKLKSIMNNRTHGHLGEQRKTCYDCVHVMPGIRGDEVTCKIYTFKYQQYNVRRKNALSPDAANDCNFYQLMTPVEKLELERKFRAYYSQLE